MDINHILKDVINLNGYITATQDVLNKPNLKVSLNIATVLSLKKIRSFEIEYLNKCDENGVACIVFEKLIAIPPSKLWGVLAKELIHLLQYWLEAIRKHLINHSTRWWMFLKLILKFIKEIHVKDPTIPNMLVEFISECLFDLATAVKPDVFQLHEILHCQNIYCAVSGREVRFAMRAKFSDYFVKIAANMATSGYLPYQYSSLECLLRWLLPRQEKSLRAAAADKWFPRDLCPSPARNLFLNRTWMNFFQDARDFLNALNEGNGLVTSVICRQLSIGKIVLINGTEKQQSWIDFNTSVKSISILLDPRVLETYGLTGHRACETLHIDNDITETAILHREPLGLTISFSMLRGPYIKPAELNLGTERMVTIVVSSKVDLRSLDKAMRTTFEDKYQLLLDLDTEVSQSPQRSYGKHRTEYQSEDDTRFSHPVEVKRHRHSGYVVKSRNPGGLVSPSTVSTSSLMQLKDRLAALPRYQFDKEPVSVCAEPALSNVTEHTEYDFPSNNSAITAKYQPYGVCQRNFKKDYQKITDIKSRSDGETVRQYSRGGRRMLSPVVSDDNSTSLLLVATLGTTDDTVINETIERLSKSKDFEGDNIVDLLVKEALESKPRSREVSDSGINTDEKKSQEEIEAIEDTPNEIRETRKVPIKKVCTVSTTDDESNTEVINETPVYPKKNWSRNNPQTTVEVEKQKFDVKIVEEFFSQHVTKNIRREILISPTLAKKINETSSETSENFDENLFCMNEENNTDREQDIFKEIAIIDCLNEMVDKVCSDVDKYTESFHKDNAIAGTEENVKNELNIKKENATKSKQLVVQRVTKNSKNPKVKNPTKNTKGRVAKKAKNIEQSNKKKMSTIVEQKEDETMREDNPVSDKEKVIKVQNPVNKIETSVVKQTETPPLRRKRKLYSPKDDENEDEIQQFTEKTSDDVPLSELKTYKNYNTPKTAATCYKELEKERKKYIRLPRTRKSKSRDIESLSPRTLKMNTMFDNLRHTIESNEKIQLADNNTDAYNFTSDSEDEDFEKKKIEIKKHTVTTTAGSVESNKTKRTRNTRRVKDTESSYEEAKNVKTVKRKKVIKRTNKRKFDDKISAVDLVNKDLIDERMREAVREELNTSILIENPINLASEQIEPKLQELPEMEQIQESESNDTMISKSVKKLLNQRNDSKSNETLASKKNIKKTQVDIHDSTSYDTLTSKKRVNKNNKKSELITIKKEKGLAKKTQTIVSDNEDSTSSPLPGLVVEESKPKYKDDVNDSLGTSMLQKFKRIHRDGPDINDSINTQNMVSDIEKFNCSAKVFINLADDLSFADINKEKKDDKAKKDVIQKAAKTVKRKKIESQSDAIIEVQLSASEKSIATDGITAHGDFDEAPPDTDTIVEVFQPRELADLDQSMRDYFTKLTQEIHNSTSNPVSSKSAEGEEVGKILRNELNKTSVSPVVSVKRLSLADIYKWIPSRRTSDTHSSHTSSKIDMLTNQINETPPKGISKAKVNVTSPKSVAKSTNSEQLEISTPESIKLRPISVAIARMSLEEFNKWLPMPKNLEDSMISPPKENIGGLKLTYRTRSKSNQDTDVEVKFTNKKQADVKTKSAKEIKSKVVETDKTDSDNVESNDITTGYMRTRSQSIRTEQNPHHSDNEASKEITHVKKSKSRDLLTVDSKAKKIRRYISPINLFEDVPFNYEDRSDDEDVNEIRNKFSKVSDTKIYSLRSTSKSIKSIESTTPVRLKKRKSVSPILSVTKRRCVESKRRIESDSRFDESKRRVDEQEKRFDASKKRTDELEKRFTESKRRVDEKERRFNESNRRFHEPARMSDNESQLRVEEPKKIEQKRLFDPKKRINVLEDVAITGSGPSSSSVNDWFKKMDSSSNKDNASFTLKDTLHYVMEKLDTTLVEINQNSSKKFVNLFVAAQKELVKVCEHIAESQTMVKEFMEHLKKLAFEMISADCQQRRAMVLLLKEDVANVLDHIEKEKGTYSP